MTSATGRMRGRVLTSLIENGKLRLPKGVQVDDLETMLELLLSARGIFELSALTDDEETFALWTLCRWGEPLKPDTYATEAATLLSHFGGISNSTALKAKFKARISPRYVKADASQALRGDGAGIKRIHDVLLRVRSQAIRIRAQSNKAELRMAA